MEALWCRDQRVSKMDSPFTAEDGTQMVRVETIAPWGETFEAVVPTSEVEIRTYGVTQRNSEGGKA